MIYDFGNVFTIDRDPRIAQTPSIICAKPTSVSQSSDTQDGRTKIMGLPTGTDTTYVQEYLLPGFHALDTAMKLYWSGIRVPTKDSYRFMRVKIAGGDKSLLFWTDDLKEGRVRLPVASINRTGYEWNKDKFSPPYLAMTQKHTSSKGDWIAQAYRPVPFLVNYKLVTWAEHKRDAEFILYQIATRFNPLAEFTMSDNHIKGNVQLRFSGQTDSSDKDVGYDQQAKVRYEYTIVAEAWLPLPEKLVPAILGRVTTLREEATNTVLLANTGLRTFTPVQ